MTNFTDKTINLSLQLKKHSIKKISGNIALIIAGLGVSVLLLEFIIRIFLPQQLITPYEGLWKPDSVLGWTHNPDIKTEVNTGERTVTYISDANGFRISESDLAGIPEGVLKVAVIGDSFVEALTVENDETFAKLLQKKFADEKINTSFINTGCAGWNPLQYLRSAEQSYRQINPDLAVVFLYVANDIMKAQDTVITVRKINVLHKLRMPVSLSFSELKDALFYPVNDFFEARSHLFIFLKQRSENILSQIGLTAYYFPDVFLKSEAASGRWAITANTCLQIQRFFDTKGVPVVFFLLPAPYQVYPEVFNNYIKGFSIDKNAVDIIQPNIILKEKLKGLNYFDLLDELKKYASDGRQLYGEIDRHFNVEGHKVTADILYPVILPYLKPEIVK